MAITTVRRIGNSVGVIIDKETIQAAGLCEGDRLDVSVDEDGGVRLTAVNAEDAFALRVGRQYLQDHRGAFEALRDR